MASDDESEITWELKAAYIEFMRVLAAVTADTVLARLEVMDMALPKESMLSVTEG